MKRLVLLSGGVDSATCLALARADGSDVTAVRVFYGQRHERELKAAKDVADYYGVNIIDLNLAQVYTQSDCSLLASSGKEIPTGTYREQKAGGKTVETYVPFRNGLLLSAAAGIALSIGAGEVWYGAHADDVAESAYPDCSEDFVVKMNAVVREGTAGAVGVVAPFVNLTKAEVVREGLKLGVPYELTWSCYEGGEEPCGKCATCIDRAKAFEANGVEDPALHKTVTKIPNRERVACITMNAHAIVKCEIGQDWYNCYLEAKFVPGDCYPDYMQVDEFVMRNIDGREMNIEVVAREFFDFLAQFKPKYMRVVNHVRDCKTHSDVDVVIEG